MFDLLNPLVVLAAGTGVVALVAGSLMIAQGLRELVRELRRHRGGADADTAEFPPVLAEPRRRGHW
jgi:hypothetical protein